MTHKAYVLIARTHGDELIPARDSIVAESIDRTRLEKLKEQREIERAAFLEKQPIPWWMEAGIIASERIEEVPSV